MDGKAALKNCPGCGSHPILRIIEAHSHILSDMPDSERQEFVECPSCSFVTSSVQDWQQRASRDAPRSDAMKMVEALKMADSFITNGIALGFIRMPDEKTPDPAHNTPGAIKNALREFNSKYSMEKLNDH